MQNHTWGRQVERQRSDGLIATLEWESTNLRPVDVGVDSMPIRHTASALRPRQTQSSGSGV